MGVTVPVGTMGMHMAGIGFFDTSHLVHIPVGDHDLHIEIGRKYLLQTFRVHQAVGDLAGGTAVMVVNGFPAGTVGNGQAAALFQKPRQGGNEPLRIRKMRKGIIHHHRVKFALKGGLLHIAADYPDIFDMGVLLGSQLCHLRRDVDTGDGFYIPLQIIGKQNACAAGHIQHIQPRFNIGVIQNPVDDRGLVDLVGVPLGRVPIKERNHIAFIHKVTSLEFLLYYSGIPHGFEPPWGDNFSKNPLDYCLSLCYNVQNIPFCAERIAANKYAGTSVDNIKKRRIIMAKEIVAMLLAGGQGSRLYALTQNLAKPAVPFGGKYRIIDFPLSNCVNSGIDTVGILTQYQPVVLNEYIGNGQPWDLDRLYGGVHVLPPYQKATGSDWFKGTANAIYQHISFIDRYDPEYVIILSGDQICKQDYSDFLKFHKEKGAQFSVAVMEVPWEEASRFGLMVADEDGRITEFQEKPKEPKSNLASMGIYIFNRDILEKYLTEDEMDPNSSNDFGNNIIPNLLRDNCDMYAYRFQGYWKDVGTISSLWEANMEIMDPEHSGINLFDEDWKIYSRNSGKTGHKVGANAVIDNAMITDGCRINGTVKHSILFAGVKVAEGAVVEDAVIMGNCVIKAGAHVKHCIVGEGATIGEMAIVGAMPTEETNGVATVGPGVKVGSRALIGPNAMVDKDVKDGDTQW